MKKSLSAIMAMASAMAISSNSHLDKYDFAPKYPNFKGSHKARFYPNGTCPDGYKIINRGGTMVKTNEI